MFGVKNLNYKTLTLYRSVVGTGSTGSIEPVNFWRRHSGTCEIAKIITIQSVNFQDMDTLEPVICRT